MSRNSQHDRSNLRNMGICAHVDAGKTTTTERILFFAGENHRLGNVDQGNTTTDFMVQEKERGITIQSAAVSLAWKGVDINEIDTPGHVDFSIEVERSMRVLDGMIVVLCAKGGVQPQTRKVWGQVKHHRVPAVFFINKMDTSGADFYRVVSQITSQLKAKPAVMQLPIGKEHDFVGVVDLITMKAIVWDPSDSSGATFAAQDIPGDLVEAASEARKALVELIAEGDDALLERYLNDEVLTQDELKAALRKATISLRLVPVVCGSAFKNKGVQPVLDAIVDYLPSPVDVDAVKGIADGKEAVRHTSVDEPTAALAFKVVQDPHGSLTFVRVYSGRIKAGDRLYNSTKDTNERVSRMVKLQGNKREEVSEAVAGDIVAFIGLKDTTTGDTLCSEDDPIVLESIFAPAPVISMAIEAKNNAMTKVMIEALAKLAAEDPSFRFWTDQETGQIIIGGQGQLHLDIKVDILKRTYNVDATTGAPQVSYRETVRAAADGVGKHVKQSGGRGQYGHAEIRLEPLPQGSGFVFEDATVGGCIPREFIKPVEKGIKGALECGPLAGYPVVDVKATLVFGSSHDVDSSGAHYELAGSMAFKDAFVKAKPVLLEPVMNLSVVIPEEYLGDVMGDINRRRGKVQQFESIDGETTLPAQVPLSEMFDYTTILRSMTKGRGQFTLEFSHYEPAPNHVAEKVLRDLAAGKQ